MAPPAALPQPERRKTNKQSNKQLDLGVVSGGQQPGSEETKQSQRETDKDVLGKILEIYFKERKMEQQTHRRFSKSY